MTQDELQAILLCLEDHIGEEFCYEGRPVHFSDANLFYVYEWLKWAMEHIGPKIKEN